MHRRGKSEKVGQHPFPPTKVKLSLTRLDLMIYHTTYMEDIISKFIQKVVDHVNLRTRLLLAQAQDMPQSMPIDFKNVFVSRVLNFNCPMR